jgi:hypothetical protein
MGITVLHKKPIDFLPALLEILQVLPSENLKAWDELESALSTSIYVCTAGVGARRRL